MFPTKSPETGALYYLVTRILDYKFGILSVLLGGVDFKEGALQPDLCGSDSPRTRMCVYVYLCMCVRVQKLLDIHKDMLSERLKKLEAYQERTGKIICCEF